MINFNTILVASIGALGAIFAAYLARGQHQIHLLVNSQLTEVLGEVKRLQEALDIARHSPAEKDLDDEGTE